LEFGYDRHVKGGGSLPVVRESQAQGVDALRQAILNQARGQARDLLRAAQAVVESVREQAEEEAASTKQEILDRARRETALEKQRHIAAARLEVHRNLLTQREEQIAGVFSAAREQLAELRRSDDYAGVLHCLIVEAAGELGGGELVVSAAEPETRLLEEAFLAEIAQDLEPETTLRPGEVLQDTGGGVLVETADGRLRYDNTFNGRFARSQDQLRSEVYRILTTSR
jgi:V/A-type H+-transporting ATPase subunit E